MRSFYLFLLWILNAGLSLAQTNTPGFEPDISLALFHSRLDKAQAHLLSMDIKRQQVSEIVQYCATRLFSRQFKSREGYTLAGNDVRVGASIGGARRAGYENYVFPHKNLGAIFIKAYKIATRDNADDASSRN